MNIIKQLEAYIPFNDQEISDKAYFLQALTAYDNLLTRENKFFHLTCSAFVVNKAQTKMLMVFHNIYQGWILPGGHADGDHNFLEVAKKEVLEETGLVAKPLSKDIFAIQSLPTRGHKKNNEYIAAHTHLDIAYLLVAHDQVELEAKEDEVSGVKWMPISEATGKEVVDFVRPINEKLISKLLAMNINKE